MPHAAKTGRKYRSRKRIGRKRTFSDCRSEVASNLPVEDLPIEMPDDTAEIYDEPASAHDEPAEEHCRRPCRCCADRRIYCSGSPSDCRRRRTAEPAAKETPVTPEMLRGGARILGRIDLKQTMRVEPAPTPVLRKPAAGTPGQLGARDGDVGAGQPNGAAAPGTDDKPKPGRHKKRVVKKQDVLESREKDMRGGRIPRKKRVLPGKEVRRTEITVPERANELSGFPRLLPSRIFPVRWVSKPAR